MLILARRNRAIVEDVSEEPVDPCLEHGDGTLDPGGIGGGRGRRLLQEAAVLAALAEQKTAHGYDLRRMLADLTGGFMQVDSSSIYRLLRRLEQDGFVTSTWTEGEHGPQRRQYRLTQEGCRHLISWRKHLETRERAFRAVIDAIDRLPAASLARADTRAS
jgi:PadR family transcriptional regulator PadR